MLDIASLVALQAARRRVQAGLWSFFAGAVALLLGVLANMDAKGSAADLADRFPHWPTWVVPESPAGYTAAALLVCWGVWALGSGLRLAREGAGRA
ncbi:hypothetical protein EZ313_00155 [Ramlibacter henchirensis]|uniref:Uncharacterized protein n=1 Tax=Ramlibacter henchirensis TaxID=204072 RepID=A0A4Z0C2F7_9BURK|nr:hypothetical protein [Ramlibacter henchirensis]TFZ05132.1 hypothetical protein EZ313_00155 [Ramlibacter henchirensis]